MDQSALYKVLEQVRDGALTPDEALMRLRHLPFEDLGFAKVDHHRSLRRHAGSNLLHGQNSGAGRGNVRAHG